jgi:hypothetical protein
VTRFETSVRIRRPIGDVFDIVADPLNFRHWNSAVRAVWSTHRRERGVGSMHGMERELPSGPVRNDIKIFAHEYAAEFGIRTTSGPTRSATGTASPQTTARLGSSSTERSSRPLSQPYWGRSPDPVKRGVENNRTELKNILETTRRPA